MMFSILNRLFAVLLLAAGGLANAAHVTDKLVVGVYPEPSVEGSPLRLISSGTPLEVLSSKGDYAEVRLADETRGWVEARYVTEEKPAKAMLLESQARLRQMGLELAALRSDNEGGTEPVAEVQSLPPSAREAQLQQALDQAQQRIGELEAKIVQQEIAQDSEQRLQRLQGDVRDVLERLAAAQGLTVQDAATVPAQDFFSRYRAWIAAAAALLLGIAAGIGIVDYRIRKRYGGFRI